MVDAVWSESTPQPSLHLTPQPQTTITPQYLQISYGNAGSANSRRESLLSPSANRRTKVQRGIAGECLLFTNSIYIFFLSSSIVLPVHISPLPEFQFRQHTHSVSFHRPAYANSQRIRKLRKLPVLRVVYNIYPRFSYETIFVLIWRGHILIEIIIMVTLYYYDYEYFYGNCTALQNVILEVAIGIYGNVDFSWLGH